MFTTGRERLDSAPTSMARRMAACVPGDHRAGGPATGYCLARGPWRLVPSWGPKAPWRSAHGAEDGGGRDLSRRKPVSTACNSEPESPEWPSPAQSGPFPAPGGTATRLRRRGSFLDPKTLISTKTGRSRILPSWPSRACHRSGARRHASRPCGGRSRLTGGGGRLGRAPCGEPAWMHPAGIQAWAVAVRGGAGA